MPPPPYSQPATPQVGPLFCFRVDGEQHFSVWARPTLAQIVRAMGGLPPYAYLVEVANGVSWPHVHADERIDLVPGEREFQTRDANVEALNA